MRLRAVCLAVFLAFIGFLGTAQADVRSGRPPIAALLAPPAQQPKREPAIKYDPPSPAKSPEQLLSDNELLKLFLLFEISPFGGGDLKLKLSKRWSLKIGGNVWRMKELTVLDVHLGVVYRF